MQLAEQKELNVETEMREMERKEEAEKMHAEEIQTLKKTKQKLVVQFPFLLFNCTFNASNKSNNLFFFILQEQLVELVTPAHLKAKAKKKK